MTSEPSLMPLPPQQRRRILMDPEIFRSGRCGMTRYYATLCAGLRALGHQVTVPLYLSGGDFMPGRFGRLAPTQGSLLKSLPGRAINYAANFGAKSTYWKGLASGAFDAAIITSPNFEDQFLAHVGRTPWLMVVHDTMRCVLGPDGLFDPAGSNADRLAYLARRADRVICISEATRQDLLRLGAMETARTSVIHTGCLLETGCQAPVPGLPERYLLFVGDRTGRKNFRTVVSAIAPMLRGDSHPGLHLVCTGTFDRWEQDLLDRLGVGARVMAFPAPDPILVTLYRQALGLVYPSLYEGFGLPLLEAMSLGCPVITAANSAIPEVAGDAVLYTDPLDHTALAATVATLVSDEALRRRLKAGGPPRAALFDRPRMICQFSDQIQAIGKA